MIRLKQYLERLRCDVQVLTFNKKQSKIDGVITPDDDSQNLNEASNDSDRMVGEQISNTIDIISKIIEANLQNDQ